MAFDGRVRALHLSIRLLDHLVEFAGLEAGLPQEFYQEVAPDIAIGPEIHDALLAEITGGHIGGKGLVDAIGFVDGEGQPTRQGVEREEFGLVGHEQTGPG